MNSKPKWYAIQSTDVWAYLSIALLAIAYLLDDLPVAIGMLAVSTILLLVYLRKSFPRFYGTTIVSQAKLSPAAKRLGFCWNIFWILCHIGFVGGKVWMLVSGIEVMENLYYFINK